MEGGYERKNWLGEEEEAKLGISGRERGNGKEEILLPLQSTFDIVKLTIVKTFNIAYGSSKDFSLNQVHW